MQDLKITEAQLFDWRGTPRPERKLAELASRPPVPSGGSEGPVAVMLFSTIPPAALRAGNTAYAVWQADPEGKLIPVNDCAERNPWESAKQIFLYYLPESLEQLDAVMSAAASAELLYAAFGGTDEDKLGGVSPDRDKFKSVYALIGSLKQGQMPFDSREGFLRWLSQRSNTAPSLADFMVRVFEELGFIRNHGPGYVLVPDAPKKDLTLSALYAARKHRPEVEQELLYSTGKELAARLTRRNERNQTYLEEIL
ncbi:single-stranded-DNA-specific exonuclease C-terminal domain-containing protein [Paenibacillus sp. P26]|nr:single-stranded-DNA-specific exonuclease C-terminal domain-containing protein [Paenibacillus sp. P26]